MVGTNYPVFEITFQGAWKSDPAPPPPPPGPCDWGDEVKGAYLAGLVPSADGGWPYDNTKLDAAQAWCCKHDDCGGVTFQSGIYQVRASNVPVHDGIATASWARKNFQPHTSSKLPQWFTRYGTRRYGSTDPNAVAAWEFLGEKLYINGGGGFGSAVSAVPVLASPPGPPGPAPPQPPGPAAPSGYKRRHPTDGFWGPCPGPACSGPNADTSIDECAEMCTKLKPPGFPGIKCVAFEVYVSTPPDTGNCYTFTSMKGAFTVLGPSRTYIRDTTDYHNLTISTGAEPNDVPTRVLAPLSLADKAEAANLGECYGEDRQVSAVDASTFQQAWALLIKASETLGTVASYKFDLIDLGRQVIGNHFAATYSDYRAAFMKQDKAACASLSQQLLNILDDYDALLSTDTNFMLGRWQSWARSWADAGADGIKNNLEYNARNQLTLWGPTGQINDYVRTHVASHCWLALDCSSRLAAD